MVPVGCLHRLSGLPFFPQTSIWWFLRDEFVQSVFCCGSSPVRSGRSLLPLPLPAVGVGGVLLLFGTIAVFIGGLVVEFWSFW